MNTIEGSSLFADLPAEMHLNIMSYLDKRNLQAISCTCRKMREAASDSQIWKLLSERVFGAIVAQGAKQPDKSWKETYDALDVSRRARTQNAAKVLRAHARKIETDNTQHRTERAAAALFGFAAPNIADHYYPTGQTGYGVGGRVITLYKRML